MKNKYIYTCPHCQKEHTHKKRFITHIQNLHSNEEEIFINCACCGKKVSILEKYGDFCTRKCFNTDRKNKTVQYIKPNHKYSFVNIDSSQDALYKNGKYGCPHCKTSFVKYSRLKRHVFDKHTEKTGICYKCGKENSTDEPYCSRACSNSREFSKDTNKKRTITLLETSYGEKIGKRTINQFVKDKLTKIHSGLYEYPNLIYKGKKRNIEAVCKVHGKFEITYDRHIRGSGCRQCHLDSIRYTKEEALNLFKEMHGERYDYSKVKYKNTDTKITIACKICKKDFYQTPKNHIKGNGCTHCGAGGFDKKREGRTYYIRIEKEGKVYYKIGITNNTVRERYGSQYKYITAVKEMVFENGALAHRLEQRIKKKYKKHRYNGPNVLKYVGTTEMFTHDVLGLDPLSQHTTKTTSTRTTANAQPLQISTTKSNTKEV